MVQGKCPHPWNKTKKGTFKVGHKQVNKGRGCFKIGKLKYPKIKEINRILGKQRYSRKIHPFYQINEIARENANPDAYYGMKKSEWIKLRRSIKERDKWRCRKCKTDLHCRKSNCHHKIPYVISKSNAEENLITLCIPCHIKEEQAYRKQIAQSVPKPKHLYIR